MRSRYSAFAVGDDAYLSRSWHSSTRPAVAAHRPQPAVDRAGDPGPVRRRPARQRGHRRVPRLVDGLGAGRVAAGGQPVRARGRSLGLPHRHDAAGLSRGPVAASTSCAAGHHPVAVAVSSDGGAASQTTSPSSRTRAPAAGRCATGWPAVHQVPDRQPPGEGRDVGDQAPVAAPPHRLAAQDGDGSGGGLVHELVHAPSRTPCCGCVRRTRRRRARSTRCRPPARRPAAACARRAAPPTGSRRPARAATRRARHC